MKLVKYFQFDFLCVVLQFWKRTLSQFSSSFMATFLLLCNIFTAISPAHHLLILVSVVELSHTKSLTRHVSAKHSKSHSFFYLFWKWCRQELVCLPSRQAFTLCGIERRYALYNLAPRGTARCPNSKTLAKVPVPKMLQIGILLLVAPWGLGCFSVLRGI